MSWKMGQRMNYRESEITKIKTQIRAEINNLRKTYREAEGVCDVNHHKRLFPEKLYKETLKQPQQIAKSTSKSPLGTDRGRKKISPVYIPDPKSLSPLQRRHYPDKYPDNVKLQFQRARHPSAYLIKRPSSPTLQSKNKSILSFVDRRQTTRDRPTKKIIPQMHVFTRQFF